MRLLQRLLNAFAITIIAGSLLLYILVFLASLPSSAVIEQKAKISPTTPENQIKIVSYNIGYLSGMTNNTNSERSMDFFSLNQKLFDSFIKETDPTLALLQEVDFQSHRSFYYHQLSNIFESQMFADSFLSINWNKKYLPFPPWPISAHFRKIVSGQAILSKFPIIQATIHSFEKPKIATPLIRMLYIERLAQIATIETSRGPVKVINVHLEAFHQPTLESQIKLLNEIVFKLAQEYPVIIGGDFNQSPTSSGLDNPINQLFENDLFQGWFSLSEFIENSSIYSTHPTDKPNISFDHILFTKRDFDLLSSRVVADKHYISDHLPIEVVLQWKERY